MRRRGQRAAGEHSLFRHARGLGGSFNRHGCTVAARVSPRQRQDAPRHAPGNGHDVRKLQLRLRPTRNGEVEMREQTAKKVASVRTCRSPGPGYRVHMMPHHALGGKQQRGADTKESSGRVEAFPLPSATKSLSCWTGSTFLEPSQPESITVHSSPDQSRNERSSLALP